MRIVLEMLSPPDRRDHNILKLARGKTTWTAMGLRRHYGGAQKGDGHPLHVANKICYALTEAVN
jgi:hypothetical protein